MAFAFRLDYIFKFLLLAAPIILSSFLVLYSFTERNFKGLIYLAGLVITAFISESLKGMVEPNKLWKPFERSPLCDLMDKSIYVDGLRALPDLHATLLAYTWTYLFLPIMMKDKTTDYLYLIITVTGLLIGNAILRFFSKCCAPKDLIAGWIVGGLFGITFMIIVLSLGDGSKFLFFPKSKSTNEKCGMVGKEKYICEIIENTSENVDYQAAEIRMNEEEHAKLHP